MVSSFRGIGCIWIWTWRRPMQIGRPLSRSGARPPRNRGSSIHAIFLRPSRNNFSLARRNRGSFPSTRATQLCTRLDTRAPSKQYWRITLKVVKELFKCIEYLTKTSQRRHRSWQMYPTVRIISRTAAQIVEYIAFNQEKIQSIGPIWTKAQTYWNPSSSS